MILWWSWVSCVDAWQFQDTWFYRWKNGHGLISQNKNKTGGNLMVWFNFEAGLVVMIRKSLMTRDYAHQNLHMV